MARKQWTDRRTKGRFLFAFSTLTTLAGFYRIADLVRPATSGTVGPGEAVMLGALALVAFALLRRALRSKTVSLRRVHSVRRVGDDRVRVTYAENDNRDADIADFEIETPTEADADEAVEVLRLKGVRVGNSRKSDAEPTSRTFRERLAKKIE